MVARIGLATLEQRNWSGGIASHVEGLTSGLRKIGVPVETSWGVGVGALARFHPFQFYPTLLSARRNLRGVDVLAAHDPRLARLGGSLRVPVVTTFHGYMPMEIIARNNGHTNEFIVEACQRFVLEAVMKSDALITVDSQIGHWLWREYGASGIHMIPNGVDPDTFHPPSAEGGTPREPRVLFAKAFTPKNGPEVADAAMELVRREIPDVLYVKTQSTPHKLMPELLRSVDVVIIPSVRIAGVEEATSCLALEAMASGLPVVASDIGGLSQLIHSGQTGILVPPGDAEVLADEVLSLLDDPDYASMIGARARECAVAHHSWDSVARETKKVYEEVLGE